MRAILLILFLVAPSFQAAPETFLHFTDYCKLFNYPT